MSLNYRMSSRARRENSSFTSLVPTPVQNEGGCDGDCSKGGIQFFQVRPLSQGKEAAKPRRSRSRPDAGKEQLLDLVRRRKVSLRYSPGLHTRTTVNEKNAVARSLFFSASRHIASRETGEC